MVTPSLVLVGAPNFLSMTTLLRLGPVVPFAASASLMTPRSRARRSSSSYFRIFAMGAELSSQTNCAPDRRLVISQGARGAEQKQTWVNYFSTIASTSRAERTRYSSPLYFTSVPPYLL